MREVKCAAARGVVEALQGFDVLYVESFVLDRWLPWATRLSDDLQVLIRDAQIDEFMDRMEARGYQPALYDQQAGGCRTLSRPEATERVLKMPVSPEPFYVHPDWVSETGEPDLLVRFHTTRRHGRLLLADLDEWFAERDGERDWSMVMGCTDHETVVHRPPLWAMMLWQTGEMMNHASDCAIPREEVDKLWVVAAQQIRADWVLVLARAEQYGADYDRRIGSEAADQLLNAYGGDLGITDKQLRRAERQYGALYELAHAIKALTDYGGRYRASVPHDVQEDGDLDRVRQERPRKLWGYPGGQEDVPEPEVLGRLGLALEAFGIHSQVEEHTGADFDYLLRHGLVELLISNAPPHGPWARSTPGLVDRIFAA
jgi:hypothetical protein